MHLEKVTVSLEGEETGLTTHKSSQFGVRSFVETGNPLVKRDAQQSGHCRVRHSTADEEGLVEKEKSASGTTKKQKRVRTAVEMLYRAKS